MALSGEWAEQEPATEGMPTFSWMVVGYVTVTYVILVMIGGRLDTPDMCVAALFFLATAFLIQMLRGMNSWRLHLAFGAVLGLAYLAKTIMFLLAFVFLCCAFFAQKDRKRALSRVFVALLIFLIIGGPFVVALSGAKGRMTFGDSGRLAYIWFVKGAGTPAHDVRKIVEDPPVYEFSTPIKGTYPPAYDPAYWNEGIRPQFEWRSHLRRLALGGKEYFLTLSSQRALPLGALILVLFSGDFRSFWRRMASIWRIWLPSAVTLILYANVLVDPRYLAAAVVVLWCSVFVCIRLPRMDVSGRLFNAVTIGVGIALGLTISTLTIQNVVAVLRRPPHVDWRVAESMRQMGIRPGDSVAVLGQEDKADYWARLAQVRVVAQLPEESLDSFWEASADKRLLVLDAFAGTGATLLVTHFSPPACCSAQWRDLAGTGYYALSLSERARAQPNSP